MKKVERDGVGEGKSGKGGTVGEERRGKERRRGWVVRRRGEEGRRERIGLASSTPGILDTRREYDFGTLSPVA